MSVSSSSLITSPSSKFLIPVTFSIFDNSVSVDAFIDSGAGDNLMSLEFAQKHQISTVPLIPPLPVKLATGGVSYITSQSVPLVMSKDSHVETLQFRILPNLIAPILLGFPWLNHHNPNINWQVPGVIDFPSGYCNAHCTTDFDTPDPLSKLVGCGAILPLSADEMAAYSSLSLDILSCDSSLSHSHVLSLSSSQSLPSSSMIPVSTLSVDDSMAAQVYPYLTPTPVASNPVPLDLLTEFADVFDPSQAEALPVSRGIHDLSIPLVDNVQPISLRPYKLNPQRREVAKQWLDENLAKGFIRPSMSKWGHPMFIIKQGNKSRLLLDVRNLNSVTIKEQSHIPLIKYLIHRLSGARYKTTLDLRNAYNQILVKPADVHKTAFTTEWGKFESLVMPFGLTNAPGHFQRFMEDIFSQQLDKTVLIYIDDIIVFGNDLLQHKEDVKQVLKLLQKHRLFCKSEKSHFYQTKIQYLGFVISPDGLEMDPSKIQTVIDWPIPTKRKDIEVFLGFTNFYRDLIPRYAFLSASLSKLLKKDEPFNWTDEQRVAFTSLKNAFQNNVTLKHVDESLPYQLETDASSAAISGILSQLFPGETVARPIAFYSRQLNDAESRYDTKERELLAIVDSLQHWEHLLKGGKHTIHVLTDHKNLQAFMVPHQLSDRQVRWKQTLQEFNMEINYRPGVENGAADALSRRPDYKVNKDASFLPLLEPKVFTGSVLVSPVDIMPITLHSPTLKLNINLEQDWPLLVADFLRNNKTWLTGIPDEILQRCQRVESKFSIHNGYLYKYMDEYLQSAMYLPHSNRHYHMKQMHETLAHFKYDSLFPVIARRYWWPTIKQDLRNFITTCGPCQSNTSQNVVHAPTPARPLHPAAFPFMRWGIDFVQNLPITLAGNRHIITLIDYCTRWVEAEAVPNMDAATVLRFLHKTFNRFGVPYELISDRGKAFLAGLVQDYLTSTGVWHHPTAGYRPSSNGMVESMHRLLGHGITTLTESHPQRWDEKLDQTVLALRTRPHGVTKYSPFYLLYGAHPRLPQDPIIPEVAKAPETLGEKANRILEFNIRELESLHQARAAAYLRSVTQKELMQSRKPVNQAAPTHIFKMDQLVLRRNHTANKFNYQWTGPYRIAGFGHPPTYWLATLEGHILPSTVNQEHLKLYHVPPPVTPSTTVLQSATTSPFIYASAGGGDSDTGIGSYKSTPTITGLTTSRVPVKPTTKPLSPPGRLQSLRSFVPIRPQ